MLGFRCALDQHLAAVVVAHCSLVAAHAAPQQGVALAVAQPLVARLASALAHDPSYG